MFYFILFKFYLPLNNSIKVISQKYGYSFIDNSNISMRIYGKTDLLNNYVLTLNDIYF